MTYSSGSEFKPNLILVDQEAYDHAYTKDVLERCSQYNPEICDVRDEAHAIELLKEKKKKNHLYLTVNHGTFVREKSFGKDCTSFEHAYCLDHISGCHFACVYCYLHSYLKHDPLVRLYVNIDEMFRQVEEKATENGALFISTGELSDSMLFDNITHMAKHMYEFLKDKPHIEVELRTKSDYTGFLDDVKYLEHMHFTWTISPEVVVTKHELKTASLIRRIGALKRCQDAGVNMGVIVDPMLHFEGWEQAYTEMVDLLAEHLDLSLVKRLFVGSFRYMKGMDQDILKKFPKTDLFTGEFVLARDGKYRYYKPIREQMYRLVKDRLDQYQKPMSLSMEFPETWRKIIS